MQESFLTLSIKIGPDEAIDFTFDFTRLEPFTRNINHSREYREDDDFIIETSEKEVYQSNGMLVKAWLGSILSKINKKPVWF